MAIRENLRPALQLLVSDLCLKSELDGKRIRVSGSFARYGGRSGVEFLLSLAGADPVSGTSPAPITIVAKSGGPRITHRGLSLSVEEALECACSPLGPSGETPVLDRLREDI